MSEARINDYNEIIKVAQLYSDGCAKGNSNLMKPAFHEVATINGAPIQALFDGIDQAGACDTANARIDVLDIVDNVAVIRIVLENYFGGNYVDFHSLMKDESGQWKIMAKVFATL